MNRRLFCLSSLVIIFVLSPQYLLGKGSAHTPNAFACNSVHYMLDDFEKQPTVRSPDKTKAVQLTKDSKFLVIVGSTGVSKLDFPDISSNIEVGWSADSSQFFISYSDGGAIGGYHVHLYTLTESVLKESRVPSAVARHFKSKHWCESRGNNLFFLGWTQDSKIGVFVAEVYPTGDCGKELGVFRGYAVNLQDGTFLRVMSKKQTELLENNCRASGKLVLPSK